MPKGFLLIVLLTLYTSVVQAQYCNTRQGSRLYYRISGSALSESRTDTIYLAEVTRENEVLAIKQKGDVLIQYSHVPTSTPTTLSYVYKDSITYRVLLDENEQNRLFQSLAAHTYREEANDSIRFVQREYQKKWKRMNTQGSLFIPLHNSCQKGQPIPETESTIRMGRTKLRMQVKGSYEGFESLSTSVGTLHCLKVSYTFKIKMFPFSRTMQATEWYAEGIGMVRRDIFDKKGAHILRFELYKIQPPTE